MEISRCSSIEENPEDMFPEFSIKIWFETFSRFFDINFETGRFPICIIVSGNNKSSFLKIKSPVSIIGVL